MFALKYKASVIIPLTEIFQVRFHDQMNYIYKAFFIYRVDATAELTSYIMALLINEISVE